MLFLWHFLRQFHISAGQKQYVVLHVLWLLLLCADVGSKGVAGATAMALTGVAKDSAKATMGTVADHFKNISNKLAGGKGTHYANDGSAKSGIPGFAERIYMSAQEVKVSGKNSSQNSDLKNQTITNSSNSKPQSTSSNNSMSNKSSQNNINKPK